VWKSEDDDGLISERNKVMPQTEQYEVLIVGSGEAGKYMAWMMARAGHRTAVIERKLVGGSCRNAGTLLPRKMG
jgi:pyruvate/2-oxoglutarate dehydrogenase complex dihydrolipoamide dehydrogenase (E3) component